MSRGFIHEMAAYAVPLGNKHRILPSLIIAQAMLESNKGSSELATEANNLFGIKGTYNGDYYEKETREWSEEKGWFTVTAKFRKYPTKEQSILDLIDKYTNGVAGEAHNRYEAVIGATPYQVATEATHKAGYATDPNYPALLNGIIEDYGLDSFDSTFPVEIKASSIEINNKKESEKMTIADYMLDDGHGSGTPGKRTPYIAALGRSILETEFNTPTVNFLGEELEYNGFGVSYSAPTDYDAPLKERTDKANKEEVDGFISVHFNAFDGSFSGANPEGFSAHVYSDKYESAKIGRAVLKRMEGGTKQQNRGLIVNNFHVLRETNMPAVLFECGFMDNSIEAMLMINESFQREVAREIAQGICDYHGVEYKAKPVQQPIEEYVPTQEDYDKGRIARVEVAKDVNLRDDKTTDSNIIRVLEAGERYYAYEISGKWHRLGSDAWASAGSDGSILKVNVFPEPVKDTVYRVKINGIQVGAYADDDTVVAMAKEAVESGKGNVELELVA